MGKFKNLIKDFAVKHPIGAFYWRKNWAMFICFFLALFTVILFVVQKNYIPVKDISTGLVNIVETKKIADNFTWFIDPLIGIFGLALTIGLTFIYVKAEWLKQLPSVLIVHIKNSKDEYIGSAYNANVLPNAELRSLGQQIMGQILNNSNLKFYPSVIIESKPDAVILVTNSLGRKVWKNYAIITFRLLESETTNNNIEYCVWNMTDKEKIEKKFKTSKIQFDKEKSSLITFQELMSDDAISISKFNDIYDEVDIKQKDNKETKTAIIDKYYFLNSTVITDTGLYDVTNISVSDVKTLVNKYEIESCIGHAPTALLLSNMLDYKLAHNRIQIKTTVGFKAIIFKLEDRLEEGKVLTKNELLQLKYSFFSISRIK
jgi:Domain of unknown function (DUF1874)